MASTEKSRTIRHIVNLRQTLRRWRSRAACTSSRAPPPDVPSGHLAICVGSRSRRFVVRAAYLNHPSFRKLLAQAEEEYGFSTARAGPLAIPCDEAHFEDLLRHLSSSSCHGAAERRLRPGDAPALPLLGAVWENSSSVW